ncbi:MAG: hypothetical protein HY459_00890 [Parcubacteria group bacterium]|nr:hypothetical protein [Parcubacteria group bacterium]
MENIKKRLAVSAWGFALLLLGVIGLPQTAGAQEFLDMLNADSPAEDADLMVEASDLRTRYSAVPETVVKAVHGDIKAGFDISEIDRKIDGLCRAIARRPLPRERHLPTLVALGDFDAKKALEIAGREAAIKQFDAGLEVISKVEEERTLEYYRVRELDLDERERVLERRKFPSRDLIEEARGLRQRGLEGLKLARERFTESLQMADLPGACVAAGSFAEARESYRRSVREAAGLLAGFQRCDVLLLETCKFKKATTGVEWMMVY